MGQIGFSFIFLPQSDVIKCFLKDGSWVCIRPSGTEPKIKYYIGVTSPTEIEIRQKLNWITTEFTDEMHNRFKQKQNPISYG